MFEVKGYGDTTETAIISLRLKEETLRLKMIKYVLENKLKIRKVHESMVFIYCDEVNLACAHFENNEIAGWTCYNKVGLLCILEN